MNPPTRDDLTGSWPRIIRYRIGNRKPILRSLAQITWCTKWVATEDNYTTVHEITDDTIQNAYAAAAKMISAADEMMQTVLQLV